MIVVCVRCLLSWLCLLSLVQSVPAPEDCHSVPHNLVKLDEVEGGFRDLSVGDSVVLEGSVQTIHSAHHLSVQVKSTLASAYNTAH